MNSNAIIKRLSVKCLRATYGHFNIQTELRQHTESWMRDTDGKKCTDKGKILCRSLGNNRKPNQYGKNDCENWWYSNKKKVRIQEDENIVVQAFLRMFSHHITTFSSHILIKDSLKKEMFFPQQRGPKKSPVCLKKILTVTDLHFRKETWLHIFNIFEWYRSVSGITYSWFNITREKPEWAYQFIPDLKMSPYTF